MKQYLPNPVNELMRKSSTSEHSSRGVMKRGAALGLSAGLMGTILKVYGVAAQDASPIAGQAAGYSIVAPADLPDLIGVTLNVQLGNDGPGAPLDQACCDKFAEATGATVNYQKGGESATDRLSFLQQTMAAGSADIDVAQIDVI